MSLKLAYGCMRQSQISKTTQYISYFDTYLQSRKRRQQCTEMYLLMGNSNRFRLTFPKGNMSNKVDPHYRSVGVKAPLFPFFKYKKLVLTAGFFINCSRYSFMEETDVSNRL